MAFLDGYLNEGVLQRDTSAIAGVEFTYLKAADIMTFENQGTAQVLYGFHKTDAADLLKAIGLESGANRCAEADSLDENRYFYTSDTLNKALAQSLEANSTTVKNALETFIRNGGTAMAPTNESGKTVARDLPVGLYLLVETKVPEMVTSTTNPFFVSLPMTTVTGNDNSASQDGGTAWNYNVVVYPKQETGIPTLEKTVREAKADTGKNEGSASITDGFAHTATGSAGDTMEYQIVSTLPTITSQATALSTYNFYDTLCEGLTYDKDAGVTVEFFTDAACTDKAAFWDKDSGKFTVTYSEDGRHMTVDIAKAGLEEINGATANKNGKLYTGYSNYTIRVTYSAVINADKTFVYGEKGNENTVILTWKRTSGDYYDTLIEDCHVFSFGLDLTKLFSDVDAETAAETKLYDSVKFKIQNKTDGTWIIAKRNDEEGVYYVTGHTLQSRFQYDFDGPFGDCIEALSQQLAEEVVEDYLPDLLNNKQDSFLEELDDGSIARWFKEAVSESVRYMVLHRCGYVPELDNDVFGRIQDFNTEITASLLGSAVSALSESILREIGVAVKSLERQQLRTFDSFGDTVYNEARKNELERSQNNGADLHNAGGLPAAQPDSPGESQGRQVRNAAAQLSTQAPGGAIHRDADEGDPERPSGGGGPGGQPDAGTADNADGPGAGRDGGTESPGSDAVGAADEQHPAGSRGDHLQSADLHVIEESPLPSVEEQISFLDGGFSVSEEAQQTFFPQLQLPQQIIDEALCMGFNDRDSRKITCAYFMKDKGLNTVCLCTFHQGIHNGAGLSSFCGIAKQPVLSAKGKGADGVLCQVVGDRHLAVR